ncbi:LysR family transcriptional regulator [Paenibacillus dendritiformis]|uniref:LysR substrate-binding domain-containing protein n=1 Tax=Paenibacillus dendritiformis TaxID=130049 RepID=UPI00248B9D21|nr:LysR family transcriptional regulator [Paenibacillus dendritiformis]WGU93834.1 LysR family transcriptional regulator [Paenibacillus dendritiformis]
MNINKLETFITLSHCLNFTEAAERLYCSQPAVSMQIQSLEEDLETRLFDRIGKKLYLTKQGELFKPYAEQIVNLLQAAKEHLHQMEDMSAGTLSFGASNFVGVYLLPSMLAQYKAQFPHINLSMKITSSQQLTQLLESNGVEFLVLSDHIPIDETRFYASTFHQDHLVFIAPPHHPLAKQDMCTLHDLQHETFLMKPDHSATRHFLDQKLAQAGIAISNTIEISSLEGIKQGVIHGLGIAAVSGLAVKQEIDSGLLVKIPMEDVTFERGIRYIYHKNKHLSPAARQFIALLDAVAHRS